jgi:hypothetical protein
MSACGIFVEVYGADSTTVTRCSNDSKWSTLMRTTVGFVVIVKVCDEHLADQAWRCTDPRP